MELQMTFAELEMISGRLNGMKTDPIRLTERERAELGRRAKSRAGRADDARIARVLLLLADGEA